MLSTRYHIASIMAVFLALGIGILIGGTLGQRWMHEAENNVVKILMAKYDQQLTINQELKKQMGSLQLIYKQLDPILHHKKILWIRPEDASNEWITFLFKAAGADWQETSPNPDATVAHGRSTPDIILISSVDADEQWLGEMQSLHSGEDQDSYPMVLDVSSELTKLTEPEDLVNFIIQLKQLTEEDHHASANFDHHSSFE